MKLCLQHTWIVYSIVNFQWEKYEELEIRKLLSVIYVRGNTYNVYFCLSHALSIEGDGLPVGKAER